MGKPVNAIKGKQGFQATGRKAPDSPTPAPRTGRPALLPGDGEDSSLAQATQTWERLSREEVAARQVSEAHNVVDLTMFRVETSYPVPQANSLSKVAAAVDAIEDGAVTDDAVAHAIGVSQRQGAYYANAAAYLGLVSETAHGSPREWQVTGAGAEFLNANAATRAEILSHVVSQIPEVDANLNDHVDIEETYSHNMSESTAERRAATIASWMDTLTDKDAAVADLRLETDGVRDRIDAARQVAVAAREAARRKTQTERHGQVCSRCFTQMPLSGACPSCDD